MQLVEGHFHLKINLYQRYRRSNIKHLMNLNR